MPNSWVGRIVETKENKLTGSLGEDLHNLLEVSKYDNTIVTADRYPILFDKLPSELNTVYSIITQISLTPTSNLLNSDFTNESLDNYDIRYSYYLSEKGFFFQNRTGTPAGTTTINNIVADITNAFKDSPMIVSNSHTTSSGRFYYKYVLSTQSSPSLIVESQQTSGRSKIRFENVSTGQELVVTGQGSSWSSVFLYQEGDDVVVKRSGVYVGTINMLELSKLTSLESEGDATLTLNTNASNLQTNCIIAHYGTMSEKKVSPIQVDYKTDFKMIADLYYYSIGEVYPSSSEYQYLNGLVINEQLICDSSAVDKYSHPELYAIMQTLPANTSTDPNLPDRVVADFTSGITS